MCSEKKLQRGLAIFVWKSRFLILELDNEPCPVAISVKVIRACRLNLMSYWSNFFVITVLRFV